VPSSLIDVLTRQCQNIEPLDTPAQLPDLPTLTQLLNRIPDTRRPQGRRYRLERRSSFIGGMLASDDVQIVHHRTTTQVEQVLAPAHIMRPSPLPTADVRQSVFHRDALTQAGPALHTLLALAQLNQQRLIGMDVHTAATPATCAPSP
jgi:hypothetical protein